MMESQQVLVVSSPTNAADFAWILSPPCIALFSISVVGSVFIFFLVCLSKTFRRTSNYLIANLCVASVYHIGVNTLYTLQLAGVLHIYYSLTTCQFLALFQRLSAPVLPLTIAFISIDRSVIARNPLDYPSRSTAFLKILFIWLFSVVLLIPRACMSGYDENVNSTFKCTKINKCPHQLVKNKICEVLLWNSLFLHTTYAVVTLFVIYIIPTYILIKEFLAMRSQMKFLTMSQVEHQKRFQRRLRVMKNACIFSVIFVTCWLPMGVTQFPFDLPELYIRKLGFVNYLLEIRDFFRMVSIFTSCLHPILLLVLSFDIREFVSSSCYV